ncbi:MAG: alpha-L-fucosidase, partial [Phycisphaeraceae bacterium]|nr:alpha-L-fucosidase [Phycisphaeraceae bacterium]
MANRPFKDTRSFQYRVDDYNEYFMNQLFELLTEYGPVHEVWFDGAHPKRKGGQTYTYDQWYEMIHRLAPNACIAIKGPDVRWCGNEAGRTRPSEWSVIPIGGTPEKWHWPDMTEQDLGSLPRIKTTLDQGGFLHWYPAETNTSIRHGWFWRDEQQHVKSAEEILDVWYRSVGGNTVFLLNIPPNRKGLFSDREVTVLTQIGQRLRQTFATNLAVGATATASAIRGEHFEPANILDEDPTTCWMPPDWTTQTEVIVSLPQPRTFNRIVLQEQIRDFSQRIAEFAVDAMVDNQWEEITKGTIVGYKGIFRTSTVTSSMVRIRILNARVCPTLSHMGLYYETVQLTVPHIQRDKQGTISMTCQPPGPVIRYTLDGTPATARSPKYTMPFALPRGGTIHAVACDPTQDTHSDMAVATYDLCPAKWSILAVSSEQKDSGEGASRAIDGNENTNWHTRWRPDTPRHPHFIAIDLG